MKQEYFSKYFVTSQQPNNLFTGFFPQQYHNNWKYQKLVQINFLESFFEVFYLQKSLQLNSVAVTGSYRL